MNSRPRQNWYLGALLLIALLVRLPSWSGQSHYLPEEFDRDLAVERGMAAGNWPLVGPPASFKVTDPRYDLNFGPAYYYLMYPLARLADFRPWSLGLTSLFFSLATIALGWWACRRWFADRRVAELFAVIAAFSNLDILFAKYPSNPNFVPFFVLLFFVALEPFLRGAQKLRHVLLAAASFAVAAQLHFIAGAALALALLILWLRGKIRPRMSEAAAFFSVSALLLLPWLANEFSHGFGGGQAMISIASGLPGVDAIIERLLDTVTFALSLWLTQHGYFKTVDWDAQKIWFTAALAANFFVIELIVWRESRSLAPAKEEKWPRHLRPMLSAWLAGFLVVLLMPFGLANFLPVHYFTGLLPLAFLLFAVGLVKLADRGYRRSSAAILASYLLWQVYQIALYHQQFPSMLTSWS